jgi:hypothetical protein
MMETRWRTSAVAALVALLAACGNEGPEGEAVADTTAAGAAAGDTAGAAAAGGEAASNVPAGPTTDLPPNELGHILILEYHRLGQNEGEWVRSPENFRRDLQRLYEKGYRPVLMRDVAEGRIDIPRGTSPVVFTIDDSSIGQFYLRDDGSIDPNTMMGMWQAFQRENPAWHYGAVWCILPAASHPSNFFGEKPDREVPREQREQRIRQKMEYIVQNRHEACNHTLYHARLDRARDDRQAQDWIGLGQDSINAYTPDDYEIVTFALPLGMWPRNRDLAWRGTYRDGRSYQHTTILEVTGGPNVSPFHREYNPRSVNRFIVAPNALERQLDRWEQNPANRYVSDGDPNTVSYPARMAPHLDRQALRGRQPREIPDAAPAAGGAGQTGTPPPGGTGGR